MAIKDESVYWLVNKLPPGSIIRRAAKFIFRGFTIKQSLHNGIICLDAVEHSWAWVGKSNYRIHDLRLQEKLLSLSFNYDLLLDIGCNIGALTLSVLLRNPKIKAICIDPNHRAISLLKKSAKLNRLGGRITIIEAAVSDKDGEATFDATGSVFGHISESGRRVGCIDFASTLNRYSAAAKCIVKLDIEGYESILLEELSQLRQLNNLCMVIELHEFGFNKFGNPKHCLKMLLESGANVTDLDGRVIMQVAGNCITQVIASWPHA